MQVKKTSSTETEVTLVISAQEKELTPLKNQAIERFSNRVKVPGFRSGKVPPELVEKHADQAALQTEFLEEALDQLYAAAVREMKLRPVDQPKVTLKKFVPFSTLEFEATVSAIGEIKLPDYTKIKKTKPVVKITEAEVKEVLESLQKRAAEKKDVNRAARDGDQVWIDFEGVDAKTKEPIKGADGKDYPLVLGSKTFIPGFEPALVGLKAGEEKSFTLTFPKDYGAKQMANRKITFKASITKVQEVTDPKLDDAFAAKVGPFKSIAELKADIKRQLAIERQNQADREFESELVREISEKTKVALPEVLVTEQIDRLFQEIRQNLTYRGQTIQEFLDAEGKTEEEYRDKVLKPKAEERVKAGLVLAEASEKEKVSVTEEELDARLEQLKQQYKDPQMQTELAKPETRREIRARMLTEKTVEKLVAHSTKK